jgi:hypothetical protein
VRSVVDLHLSRRAGEKQGEKVADKDVWLVGDKCTVADLSWFIWEQIADYVMGLANSPIQKVSSKPHPVPPRHIYLSIHLSIYLTFVLGTCAAVWGADLFVRRVANFMGGPG